MQESPGPDPLLILSQWHAEAVTSGAVEPDAMTLATVTADGAPMARTVLFKGIERGAIGFVTNFDSRKGQQLARDPRAALVFLWAGLKRQVCVRGRVEQASAAVSDEYFRSRPRESQLGAWASAQSQPIASRAELEQRFAEVSARFAGRDVERPPNWGMFRLTPDVVELWYGGAHRLHDRFEYVRTPNGTWQVTRLSP
jgi:pyridoxamine 5'-phosphate oxidase